MHDSGISSEFPKENRLIYDWVSFTTRRHTVVELVALLGFNESGASFETVKGSKGFMWRLYFGGVSIHFNEFSLNHPGEFIWLEMSGAGCRSFESFGNGNYENLFKLAREDPTNVHLTRLDIAFDDMTGVFDIDTICDYTREQYFVSRMSTYQSIYSNKGNSVFFGSRMSKVLIRIYDKAKERGFTDGLHWVRVELQLKDNNAKGFIDKLPGRDLQDLYLGVLKNYLSFREPGRDSNKRRWRVCEWWDAFLDDAVRTSVWSTPGVDYNLSACERYVLKQPVGSIKTLIEIHGSEGFFSMIENAPPPKNPKYRMLIAQAKAEMQAQSDASVLERWIELVGDNELEVLAELKEGYDEIDRVAKLRYDEEKAAMKAHYKRELEERIHNELERDRLNRASLNNESKGDT